MTALPTCAPALPRSRVPRRAPGWSLSAAATADPAGDDRRRPGSRRLDERGGGGDEAAGPHHLGQPVAVGRARARRTRTSPWDCGSAATRRSRTYALLHGVQGDHVALGLRRDPERPRPRPGGRRSPRPWRCRDSPADAKGVTAVTIPVDGDTTPTGTGNWTADLGCRPGSCANVYPVRVTLADSSGARERSQLVTYLVYDDPSSNSQLLRFALVVPLGLAPSAAQRAGEAPTVVPAAAAGLESLVGALETSPAVPLTLAPDPGTLEQLAAGRSHTVERHRRGCRLSRTDRPCPGRSRPSTPVPWWAVGLTGELKAQLRRGAQVLSSSGVGVHASKGTWVARTALTQGAIDELAGDFGHLVVPPTSVSGPMGPLTVTQPFTLSPSSPTSRDLRRGRGPDGRGGRRRDRIDVSPPIPRPTPLWPRCSSSPSSPSSTTRPPTSWDRPAPPRREESWAWPRWPGRRAPPSSRPC